MPEGNNPPMAILSQAVFNAVHSLTYSASDKCFVNGTTLTYLFIEKSSTSELPQWNYGTAAEAAAHNNPRGEISQAVADILNGGAYNSTDGTVSKSLKKYKFRLERDTNGVDQVAAVQV